MTKRQSPSMSEWRALYQAADAFKQAAPWQWLYDADLICVENPETGTIGYCSIMGRGGEHYALGVYLGDSGIYGFNKIMSGSNIRTQGDFIQLQNCIMCSFEDRDLVMAEDYKIIKALGLKYRGRNAWPVFRRYEPGYYPWYITSEECRFLTVALQQSLVAAQGIKDGSIKVDMENGRTVVRRMDKATGTWDSNYFDILIPSLIYPSVEITDDILITKLNKLQRNRNFTVELGVTYMPLPVGDKGQRPYFPRLLIAADAHTGAILSYDMYDSIDDDVNTILDKLIGMFLNIGLPSRIYIRDENVTAIIGDLCNKIGVKIKVKPKLPAVDEFIDEMSDRMGI